MKARLLADADFHPGIINGFLARRHAVDFEFARGVIPDGMSDLEVLAVAAYRGRVVVSHDRSTMPLHFRAQALVRVAALTLPTPGFIHSGRLSR